MEIFCKVGEGARALFVLAPEMDPECGVIELTGALPLLVEAGLSHPHEDPEDGVPFGELELSGEVTVMVDGESLDGVRLAELVGGGLVHVIRQAVDAELSGGE